MATTDCSYSTRAERHSPRRLRRVNTIWTVFGGGEESGGLRFTNKQSAVGATSSCRSLSWAGDCLARSLGRCLNRPKRDVAPATEGRSSLRRKEGSRQRQDACSGERDDLPAASLSFAKSYRKKSISTALTLVALGSCLRISRRMSSTALDQAWGQRLTPRRGFGFPTRCYSHEAGPPSYGRRVALAVFGSHCLAGGCTPKHRANATFAARGSLATLHQL